jgi:predicted amino acid dehydrogenase
MAEAAKLAEKKVHDAARSVQKRTVCVSALASFPSIFFGAFYSNRIGTSTRPCFALAADRSIDPSIG